MFKMYVYIRDRAIPFVKKNGLRVGTTLLTESAERMSNVPGEYIPVSVSGKQISPTKNKKWWLTTEKIPPDQLTHDIESLKESRKMSTNIDGRLDAVSFIVKGNKDQLDVISQKFDQHIAEDNRRNAEQNDRLTRLETEVSGLKEGQQIIHNRIDKLQKRIDGIQTAVSELKDDSMKIKGAVAITQWATLIGATLAGGVLIKLIWG